jgi:cytochrome c-type biogenesis protein CcmH
MLRFLRPLSLLLALMGFAAEEEFMPSKFMNGNVKRAGEKLACRCGSCRNTVGSCSMVQCGFATPARKRIAEMQSMGSSDQQIVAKFVETDGIQALAEPPAEGFNLLGWVMPFAAIFLGLTGIWAWWRHFLKPGSAAVPTTKASAAQEARAAREMDQFEE